MKRSEFLTFGFELYKDEQRETDRLYGRYPLAISANVLIAGVIVYLTRDEYLDGLFTSPTAIAYYAGALLAAGSLIASFIFLAIGIIPRTYSRIADLVEIVNWRATYEAELRAAFEQGAALLLCIEPTLLAPDRCGLAELDAALERLARASPTCMQQLLTACAACITADRKVTQAEGELMRAIADALDCPMPPLLPGQPLA